MTQKSHSTNNNPTATFDSALFSPTVRRGVLNHYHVTALGSATHMLTLTSNNLWDYIQREKVKIYLDKDKGLYSFS